MLRSVHGPAADPSATPEDINTSLGHNYSATPEENTSLGHNLSATPENKRTSLGHNPSPTPEDNTPLGHNPSPTPEDNTSLGHNPSATPGTTRYHWVTILQQSLGVTILHQHLRIRGHHWVTIFQQHLRIRLLCFVCWLLIVPATCEYISGTDLLRQFYVLPH